MTSMRSTNFRCRFGEDAYPISRFIVERANSLGFSRGDLAGRLGYRNIGSAHQALGAVLITGTVPPHMALHLDVALDVDKALLAAVIAATRQQKEDEGRARILAQEAAYRLAFRPHLRTETARTRPEPIFVAALIGTARLRVVTTPDDVWQAAPAERDAILRRIIQEHFDRQRGWVPAFGGIVGYTAVVTVGYAADFGLPYDVDGNPGGSMRPVDRLREATLGTKRGDTRLTGLLRNTPIAFLPAGDEGSPEVLPE